MYKVVLITNQPIKTQPITKVLEADAYQLILATDTLSGLWYIENIDPDLILLDLELADLSGAIIASRLNHLSRDIPIVALATNSTLERSQLAIACGCKTVMTQPIETTQFLQEIAAFLPISA